MDIPQVREHHKAPLSISQGISRRQKEGIEWKRGDWIVEKLQCFCVFNHPYYMRIESLGLRDGQIKGNLFELLKEYSHNTLRP